MTDERHTLRLRTLAYPCAKKNHKLMHRTHMNSREIRRTSLTAGSAVDDRRRDSVPQCGVDVCVDEVGVEPVLLVREEGVWVWVRWGDWWFLRFLVVMPATTLVKFVRSFVRWKARKVGFLRTYTFSEVEESKAYLFGSAGKGSDQKYS